MARGARPVRHKSVLVVDDDLDFREAMADAVQSTGRQTITARNGADALVLLDSPSLPRPCLVLLDWTMTPMGGAEFLSQLNARADAGEFRVIIVSGSSPAEAMAAMASVLAIRTKPFEFEELVKILDEHC